MNGLPQPAKRLVICVTAAASLVFVSVLFNWHSIQPVTFAFWELLATLAGMVKVRFPGVTSSYSFGYIVVLAAMAMLPFSQAVVVSMTPAIVQSYWLTSKRPTGIQVAFNVFGYAISSAACWYAFHGLQRMTPDLNLPARFMFGAAVFFVIHSGLVAGILGLVARRAWLDIWENTHLMVFPYYLGGAACAACVAAQGRVGGWWCIPLLPVLAILYASMRVWVRKLRVEAP